jgi:hypothetical protein
MSMDHISRQLAAIEQNMRLRDPIRFAEREIFRPGGRSTPVTRLGVVTRVRLQGADRPSGGRRRIVSFDPATTLEVRNGWAFLHAPWIEVVTFEVA